MEFIPLRYLELLKYFSLKFDVTTGNDNENNLISQHFCQKSYRTNVMPFGLMNYTATF